MVAGAKGDTPEVVGRHLNMIRIQAQQTSSARCRVLGRRAKSYQARWGCTPGQQVAARDRRLWRSSEFFIIYTRQQDITTPARAGVVCRPTDLRTSLGGLWGLTRSQHTTRIHITGLHKINQNAASPGLLHFVSDC